MATLTLEATITEVQLEVPAATALIDQEPRDEAWFASLYDQTFDMVDHYARTLIRDREAAEDVVADTYLKVWRARSNFSGRGSVLSWVMAITRNCAMDHLRARKPNVSLDLFEAIGDPGGPDVAEPWLSEADAEAMRHAVSRLSEEHQQVIFLRFYQELSHDAVAAKLGKSPTAIRQIQFRALMRLRKLLQGEAEPKHPSPAVGTGRERRGRTAVAPCRARRFRGQKAEGAGP